MRLTSLSLLFFFLVLLLLLLLSFKNKDKKKGWKSLERSCNFICVVGMLTINDTIFFLQINFWRGRTHITSICLTLLLLVHFFFAFISFLCCAEQLKQKINKKKVHCCTVYICSIQENGQLICGFFFFFLLCYTCLCTYLWYRAYTVLQIKWYRQNIIFNYYNIHSHALSFLPICVLLNIYKKKKESFFLFC